MSYPINKSNGSILVTLEDGQLNSATSVGLVGRNYVGYGEIQNENFLHLLENFANVNPPVNAIAGQLWYSTSQKILNVYDEVQASWHPVGSAYVAQNSPPSPINGQIWFDSSSNQLKIYTGSSWVVVGPESVSGFGVTKASSTTLVDTQNGIKPVILLTVDNTVVAIIATSTFNIKSTNAITGFNSIVPGINMGTGLEFTGSLNGTSDFAKRLSRSSKINGIGFDGAVDITITSNTTNTLTLGDYLSGADFNGSAAVTMNVNASFDNTPDTVVARDSAGNFAANEITATLIGQVKAPTGLSVFDSIQFNKIIGTGTLQVNSATASALSPGATINDVLFTGSQNIKINAPAATLTGTGINATVVDSKLQTVGDLKYLNVAAGQGGTAGDGIRVGAVANAATMTVVSSTPTVSSTSGKLTVTSGGTTSASLTFLNLANSTPLTLTNPSILPGDTDNTNLGSADNKFKVIYATTFEGIATKAYYADLAENYVADAQYEPGTVVEFGGQYEVTLCKNKSTRVAGVVSTNPAYLMNSHQEGEFIIALALQGKVPCKVAGVISKGDLLISGGHGYAIAAIDPKIGTVIGKALEDFHGEYGVINVVVGRV
jgi:hypothetical protein